MKHPRIADSRRGRLFRRVIITSLLCLLGLPWSVSADNDLGHILADAQAFLHEGTIYLALERLKEATRVAPNDYRVHKLRGDVLMSFRRNQEAVAAYRKAAELAPAALEVHWALWALLDRMAAHRQAILTLQEIARLDPENPLAHLRLARAYGQSDRLEEAVASYRRAVELEPDIRSLRLPLARALFDVLDYEGARQQVEFVLARAETGSPEWASARDLLAYLRGETHDPGRRFDESQTLRKLPWYSERNLKRWVLTRGEGWRLMEQGRHAEAEQAFRRALEFNPEDHRTWYDLGQALTALGRYEEAIEAFEKGIALGRFAEFYPDSVFQIGRCLAKLGRWTDAIARFQRVLEIRDWRHEDFYALNFPDLAVVQQALDEATHHAPGDGGAHEGPASSAERLGPEPYEYPIPPMANGHKLVEPLPTMAELTPLGTDTVHGPFRQLTTTRDLIQEDLQTGLHDFIPVNPTDTFSQQEEAIYLVFTLTGNQEDLEAKLASRWVAERVPGMAENTVVGVDSVLLGLNERSGYFRLTRPDGGWRPGIYRVDLYLGPQVSAYTHVADIRFRILAGPSR